MTYYFIEALNIIYETIVFYLLQTLLKLHSQSADFDLLNKVASFITKVLKPEFSLDISLEEEEESLLAINRENTHYLNSF